MIGTDRRARMIGADRMVNGRAGANSSRLAA